MLKKYAKRFSRSVMGGLGPGAKTTAAAAVTPARESNLLDGKSMNTYATIEEDQSEVYRWPPHSRKVIDDEVSGGEESRKSPRRPHRRCRSHLSSCSTTTSASTGEEGFGSESSLEELRITSHRLAPPVDLKTKSSSISSLSSTGSDSGVSETVSHLRSALFYYPLVSSAGGA